MEQLRQLRDQAERIWGPRVTVNLSCHAGRHPRLGRVEARIRLEIADATRGVVWERTEADTEVDILSETFVLLKTCADQGSLPVQPPRRP
jgi:hypothetical protein